MSVDLKTIKTLTKKLAMMNFKEYNSLKKIKDNFDSLVLEFIDLDPNNKDLIESLKIASNYFNLLTEEDFNTNDKNKMDESKSIISKITKELNSILIKWRKLHDHYIN